MAEIAAAILTAAPPRFALAGISMGGYICLEIMRLAPERVIKLALLDTSARPDTPAQTTQRRALVALARTSDFGALVGQAMNALLHPAHQNDPAIREVNVRMGLTVGVEGLSRQTGGGNRTCRQPPQSSGHIRAYPRSPSGTVILSHRRSRLRRWRRPSQMLGLWSCRNAAVRQRWNSRKPSIAL